MTRMIAQAFTVFPTVISWDEVKDDILTHRVKGIECEAPCEPPETGKEHFFAVWRAADQAGSPQRERGRIVIDESWQDEVSARRAKAGVGNQVRGEYHLIADLPDSASPKRIRVWYRRLGLETPTASDEAPRFFVELGADRLGAQSLVWDCESQALTQVTLRGFKQINPRFFMESAYDDPASGEMKEWHEVPGWSEMPGDSATIYLAKQLAPRTRVGGFPIYGALGLTAPPCVNCNQPMRYAVHLGTDFFDVEFGDAGSAHIWVCDSGCGGLGQLDSA